MRRKSVESWKGNEIVGLPAKSLIKRTHFQHTWKTSVSIHRFRDANILFSLSLREFEETSSDY